MSAKERSLICYEMGAVVDFFGAKAKASECRLLAVNSCGLSRDRFLALADDYDAINEAVREALLRFHVANDGAAAAELPMIHRRLDA